MKKFIFFTLSVVALSSLIDGITGCSKKKSTQPPPPPKPNWTIMCYIDGNNNLDYTQLGTSFYIRKVQDMETIGSTDNVKVVAMVSSMKTGGVAKYYYVTEHHDELPDSISSEILKDKGTTDMSSGSALETFISYVLGQDEYQAEHYMLVLADHGGGWRGLCWDEIQDPEGGAFLSLPELKEALSSIGKKFDIIAFDACLMGMSEVAYEIKDYADYMIASQNVTWATIDLGYPEWLGALTKTPNMDPAILAEDVAKAIYNAGVSSQMSVVTATIDLSKMAHLGSCLGTFANDLVTFAGQYGLDIQDARTGCHVEEHAPDFVDLKEFVGRIKNEPNLSQVSKVMDEADALIDAVSDAIHFVKGNVTYPRNGLSIYFPISFQYYSGTDATNYSNLAFKGTNWYNFIAAYMQTFGGGTLIIHSDPQSAEVFLDGQDLGHQTPLTIGNVSEGDHIVKLTLTGYQDWQQTVHVYAGQTTEINATLTPLETGTGVSGTVTYGGQQIPANTYPMYSADGQTFWYNSNNTVSANGDYSITDMDAGQYYIAAWNNVNGNDYIDTGDLWGVYPDLNNPQKVTVTSDHITPNINFSISEITGKLSIKVLRQAK